jgi:iron complex outermembrane receptor protein
MRTNKLWVSRARALLLLTTALVALDAASVSAAVPEPVRTDASAVAQAFRTAQLHYEIAPGPLGPALHRWAEASKLNLLVPSKDIGNLKTEGLSGTFTPSQALDILLTASALKYELAGAQIIVFDPRAGHDALAQATTLPTITVEGQQTKENSTITPPPPYAGGQVATGGQVGLLGNRNVMDTPFSQTNYTAKLIQDQQARTVGDVMFNDPSVRVKTPNGNGVDGLYIRGFYYDSGDYALNGLYGIAPFYSTSTNYIDRVEVLKGPAALLNGMPPAGAVGGSVNLVTKTAPDTDITQVTGTYASKSQFGVTTDVSRRYGKQKEWGVRVNGQYRSGDTAYDRQKEDSQDATINLDYRGEQARFAFDAGTQSQNLTPPLRFLTFTSQPGFGTTVPILPPPDPSHNYMPSWATWKPRDKFVTARGEVDLSENFTVYGAYGYHRSDIDFIYPSPRITAASGAWTASPFQGTDTYNVMSGEAGIRANFDTGPFNHHVTVNYSNVRRFYDSSGRAAAAMVTGNIYNAYTGPIPNFSLLVQNIETKTSLASVGVADVISMFNKRVQFIVGARRQMVRTTSYNYPTSFSTATTSSTVSDDVWSPAFGIVVKPVENVSLYANYIEGIKAPEVVTGATTYSNVGDVLPAAQTKQKEVGVKVDFGRITATFSAFEISWPNSIAVAVAGAALPARDLNGEQLNRGLEFYVFGEVTPALRVLGGVTLMDGELVKFNTAAVGGAVTNYDGNRPVGISRVNVNFGAEWDTPFVRDLTLTGRVIYTSDSYANDLNTQVIPGWTRVDIGARYTATSPWNGKPIVIRANIENLFDKGYYNAYRTVSSAISIGAPRTYLLSTTFNF